MKKKVLILANHILGLYNFRKELIEKLIFEGYEVFFSLPEDSQDEKVKRLIDMGAHHLRTPLKRRGMNPLEDILLIFQYFKLIKQINPDIVLTYTIKPNIYGGLVCRALRIPYINNITGLGSGFLGKLKPLLILLYKIALKDSLCVFFQNKDNANFFISNKIVNGIYQILPGSGINLKEFKFAEYPDETPNTFLFIGRIMKDKGIDEFLEAAKIIKKKYPNTQFNIIGFIEETEPHYKTIIKQYQDENIIHYLGYQSNVTPYIKTCHCLIQPSHGGEGLSNVLLEAGAVGRALIATNIPGCKETIEEGRNGFIFEPKNIKSLVKKLEQFISLPYEEKKMMGKNSRKKIEIEYDRNLVVNEYLKYIRTIE